VARVERAHRFIRQATKLKIIYCRTNQRARSMKRPGYSDYFNIAHPPALVKDGQKEPKPEQNTAKFVY
jgi:hypothetical protein